MDRQAIAETMTVTSKYVYLTYSEKRPGVNATTTIRFALSDLLTAELAELVYACQDLIAGRFKAHWEDAELPF